MKTTPKLKAYNWKPSKKKILSNAKMYGVEIFWDLIQDKSGLPEKLKNPRMKIKIFMVLGVQISRKIRIDSGKKWSQNRQGSRHWFL